MTDEQLALRAGDGDELAFQTLAKRYEPLLRFFARQRFGPGLDDADLYQEALLALWRAVRSYRPETGHLFKTLAQLVVKRHLDTAARTATRHKHGPLNTALRLDGTARGGDEEGDALHEVIAAPHGDPHELLVEREQVAAIVDTIQHGLTRLERESIIGFAFCGESYGEIEARILAFDGDRPGRAAYDEVKVVDNALSRARWKLRRAVADGGQAPLGVAA